MKDKSMKSDVNQILKNSFTKEFNNAKKRYDAEMKQKPLISLTNGRMIFNVCLT